MAGATPLGNMVIKLGLDDADFGRGVANSQKQIRYLGKEMQANMRIADLAGNQQGKLGERFNGLSKIIGAQEKQVADLKKAYDDSFVDGKATDSTKRLASQLQDANGKLANYKKQLIDTAGAIAEYQVKNEGLTGAINKDSDNLIKKGKAMEDMGGKLTKGLTLPIAAGAFAVTKAAISWESAFAGVLKTNDEVIDKNGKVVYSYKDLENGLRDLANELPVSHSEIAATAEAAGQLGIQTDNVVSFTKTMIDMGESTTMSAETAATSMARFANITQMSQNDFDRLGSVIVDLGNNFATTEGEITEMALRLAGAGSQIGMSEAQIMSFAAGLSSVGIAAEAGGSAFSKVMINMQLAAEKGMGAFDELISLGEKSGLSFNTINTAVQKGGKELKSVADQMGLTSKQLSSMYKEADKSATSLQNFAEVAGMTNSEFGNLFKEDPSKAIMSFVEGLSKAEEKGMSAIKVLDDMDIKEVRLRDSLLRAAGASDVFGEAIERGNTAWEENTALAEEAGKRYETTQSQMDILRNHINNIAIDLGGPLLKALNDTIEVAKPTIKSIGDLAKSFSDADPKTQKMILRLLAATAAAGPLLSITGKTAGGVGKLGKSFVELSASMAKKKAIEAATRSLADGNVSAGNLLSTLSAGKATVTNFGGAAATAGGAKGVGAMTASLSALGPVGWSIVGAGGLLAVGYGAWKLWGEEAWNAGQRTKRWGTDVGEATDQALSEIQTSTQTATGQFSLMEQGFSANTEKMVSNFERIGATIENELTEQVNAFKQSIELLPDEIQGAAEEIVEKGVEKREEALAIVQENNNRILDIKKRYIDEDGKVTIQGAKMIQDLMKQSTQEYLKITVEDADARKEIMTALTGDVENASREQAEAWIVSLGRQRAETKESYTEQLNDYKAYLDEKGILNTEEGKQLVELFETARDESTTAIDAQIAMIAEKYPELAEKIWFANGQAISGMEGVREAAKKSNEQILSDAQDLSNRLAANAKKNAEVLAWTADESTKAGQIWNSFELVDKEGNIKSNANEIVAEATKDITTWNDMKILVHDADLDSNAKKIIGEAAIANNRWDGMAFEDKEAVLQDEFSINMYKALDQSGKWNEMSLEEKTAFLYSNTPEVMAETMLELGLWDEFEPVIKELGADNFELLVALSQSEEALNTYNGLDPLFKELLADDPATITYQQSKKFLDIYNGLDPEMKKLLGNNSNVNMVVATAEKKLKDYDKFKPEPKKLHATADTSAIDYMRQEINKIPDNTYKNIWLQTRVNDSASKTMYNRGISGIRLEKGTNFHKGGPMVVNDQRGPLYRELVQYPNGVSFIPEGRDVFIPDAPRGTKVYTANLTKQKVPRYAEGVGVPKNATVVRNLERVANSESRENRTPNIPIRDYTQEFSALIKVMENFGNDLKNLKIILDGRDVTRTVSTRIDNKKRMDKLLRGENV